MLGCAHVPGARPAEPTGQCQGRRPPQLLAAPKLASTRRDLRRARFWVSAHVVCRLLALSYLRRLGGRLCSFFWGPLNPFEPSEPPPQKKVPRTLGLPSTCSRCRACAAPAWGCHGGFTNLFLGLGFRGLDLGYASPPKFPPRLPASLTSTLELALGSWGADGGLFKPGR